MKTGFIFIINIYQKIVSPTLKNLLGVRSSCRFSPTCSEYAKQTINEKGLLKGVLAAVTRISKCQPFYQA